ncbi:TonB family protein [Sphaerotilus mobilis]|uniref:TonB family protein n=1 Tax=Sphaerotilus mobilis TaxID=47994 RepID=A0A4Q7LUZ9_9BURK|nr:TonB family protein [Sphaerotilus mobilis]
MPSTAEASTEAAPAPSPAPSTAPAAAPATSTHATTAAAPAPPAAPRPVTLSATDWVRPPVYAYPREAVRRREQGVVALRILFDTQGVPRRVSLLRSSGSATLDEEALAKARAARARPRLQDGVPVEFLADTEAEFKV